ncbi:hypothetical protein L1887_42067 [Cichorium endivia]|nr:hypothetical protein L1887_42067 [Cichorium endivia]
MRTPYFALVVIRKQFALDWICCNCSNVHIRNIIPGQLGSHLGSHSGGGSGGRSLGGDRLGLVGAVEARCLGLALLEQRLGVGTQITGVRVGVQTHTVAAADLLDVRLVDGERLDKLVLGDVVGEDARAERLGEHKALQAVARLLDRLVGLAHQLVRQQGVVHRQTHLARQAEPLVAVLVANVAAHVRERHGPRHVDADSVAVAQRREGRKLERRRDRVTVGDHTVQANLVQVGRLEVEHALDGVAADLVGGCLELLGTRSRGVAAVGGVDEVLAVLGEQVPRVLVRAVEDLDELGRAVARLADGQRLEEVKVEEGVHGCVVGAQAVLELLVVDAHLDRDGGVDERDERRAHTDVVGAATVRGTRVAEHVRSQTTADHQHGLLADQTKRVHGVHKAEHGVHGLVQLTALEDVERRLDVVGAEVCWVLTGLDGRAVQLVEVLVEDAEDAAPLLVVGGEPGPVALAEAGTSVTVARMSEEMAPPQQAIAVECDGAEKEREDGMRLSECTVEGWGCGPACVGLYSKGRGGESRRSGLRRLLAAGDGGGGGGRCGGEPSALSRGT